MNPHLMLAQALAASLAPVRTRMPGPTLEQAYEALEAVTPRESDAEAHRGAVIAAADALCGDDDGRWMELLAHIALWRPRDLVEVRDGRS